MKSHNRNLTKSQALAVSQGRALSDEPFDRAASTNALPLGSEEKHRLQNQLQLTANDLFYCGSPVEWAGTRLLEALVQSGQSCAVVADRGSGMGSAVAWLDSEPSDGFAAIVPADLPDLYLQLWQAMGQPVDGIRDACQVCPRYKHCPKSKPYLRKRRPDGEVVKTWKPNFIISDIKADDDVREYVNFDDKCLFPKACLTNHKNDWDLPKIIVIRLPTGIDKNGEITELTELLRAILNSDRALIVLASREQEKYLGGPGLGRLHRVPWPRPDARMLADMLTVRMAEAEITSLPFEAQALNTIALLADYRPGPFLEILNNSLLLAEGLIQPADVLGMIELTEKAVVNLALAGFQSGEWFAISDLADSIYEKFRRDIPTRKLGRHLRHLGFEYRRGDAREYCKPSKD